MNHQITVSSEFRRHSSEFSRAATVAEMIRLRAVEQGDHLAIESSAHAPLSYRELQGLIQEVRAGLRCAGFGRNARIAVAMPNGPRAALAIVAVACSAVSIPINPKQTMREIEVCLTAVQADAVLLMNGDSLARQAAERQGVPVIEAIPSKEGSLGFSIIASFASAALPGEPDEPDPKAPAFILQTSGTAAEPKLIPFSHRNMLAASARLHAWFKLTPQDRCLSVSPPFYSHGLKVTVFTPLLTGGTVVFPKDASKFDFAEWFSFLKPTWYSAGPTLHRLIFDQIQFSADAKTRHSLRFILSGGAPLPPNVLVGLQDKLGTSVVEHYGSSEAAQIAANLPAPGPSKLGTCGIPWPDTVRIVGDDGTLVRPGEQGEILLGGPTLISGYLNADELNQTCFVNGWFRTGDIGSLDEEGFLTLHGRKDDVINRGAEKISPREIDEALMRHPAIAEAAAFAVAHPRLGEDVAAAVVLREGMTATAVELRRYLQDQLASFKIPRQIIFKDQLPKGKTGKIVRRHLSSSFDDKSVTEMRIGPPRSSETMALENAPDSTVVAQMTQLWERLLQVKPILLDDDFLEKGGDSLLAMDMLSEVERLTGQTIPSSILFEANTIRQLAQKLSDLDIQSKSLIQLNPSGGQLPLFLFHGDYLGGGLYSLRLATLLGSDQPLFVVAPHDLGGQAVARPIEEIAADYLPVVLKAQPKGPYRLSGYCFGGLIAFEVARLLVAAGETVEMVSMIDSPTINARQSVQLLFAAIRGVQPLAGPVAGRVAANVWHKYSIVFDRTSSISLTQLSAWLMRRARELFAGGGDKVTAKRIITIGPNEELRLRQLFERHTSDRRSSIDMLTSYSPKPLSVPVLFFEAEFSSKAWRRISSNIEAVSMLKDVADRHGEVVRNPANLEKMAASLRAWLEAHALQETGAVRATLRGINSSIVILT